MASFFGSSRSTIRQNRCNAILFIIGLILLLLGGAAFFGLTALVKSVIVENLTLRPDSSTFKQWSHPPADVYIEIYLMNVTNPEQAALGLEKPNLVNQGPYVFYEIRRKLNATFHGNGTMTFYEPIFYFWNQKRSGKNKLTDKITQLDLVVAGMSHQFSHCTGKNNTAGCANPFFSQTILPSLGLFDINHELFNVQRRSIFKTYTVKDFLFNGFIDPFLVKFKPIAKMAGQKVPTRIGLFYGRNGSATGLYTIETGERDIRNYQMVTHYNGQTIQTVWTTPFANRIYGTIGHGFKPFLTKAERIHIFAGDLCRASELEYSGERYVDGVKTYVYKPPNDMATVGPWPENENARGFCVPDTNHCPPDGLMDETPCIKEPTFMGKPHFHESDPLLGTVFTGLSPNEEEHETEMCLDPFTGAVIEVKKRLMIYFPIRQSFITKAGNIHLTPNVHDGVTTIFPMFWVNETAKVRKVVFDQIIYLIYPAFAFAYIAPFVLLASGLVLLLIGTIRFVVWRNRNVEKEIPTTDTWADEAGYTDSAQQVRKNQPSKQKEGESLRPLLLSENNDDNNKCKNGSPSADC